MSKPRVQVRNLTHPLERPLFVRQCQSFWCRFLGLMGRASLAEDEGLLFVWPRAGRMDTALHMLFMRFPITAVWLDDRHRVVDVRLLKPWVGVGVPRAAAKYVLEVHSARLRDFQVGDEVVWDED